MAFPLESEAGGQSSCLCDRVSAAATCPSRSKERTNTLQELFGPGQGSNAFLGAAALIRVATAGTVSLQNIPWRRRLAVLP